jgi:hypothetical protein
VSQIPEYKIKLCGKMRLLVSGKDERKWVCEEPGGD